MSDDPLDAVYSFVERAYVRMQAGEALNRCMEDGRMEPIQQMVEGLVVAGPQNIGTLQEILAETEQRKSQVLEDLHQVFSQLEQGLKEHGVSMSKRMKTPSSVARLTGVKFLALLKEQNINDEEKQISCLRLWQNSKELILPLKTHIKLLEEIQVYLQDWLWGLAYQSARQRKDDPPSSQQGLSL